MSVYEEHATTGLDYEFGMMHLGLAEDSTWSREEGSMKMRIAKHYETKKKSRLARQTWGDGPGEALSKPKRIRFYEERK